MNKRSWIRVIVWTRVSTCIGVRVKVFIRTRFSFGFSVRFIVRAMFGVDFRVRIIVIIVRAGLTSVLGLGLLREL